MAKKLWQTGNTKLHPLVQAYTVGDDYIYDNQLLPYDIAASKAHAEMLAQMKVLNKTELSKLQKGLDDILAKWQGGQFKITAEDEDCHTAIENYLTKHYGEVGKKIHTGRSRNDQALVMLRLYSKAKLSEILAVASTLQKTFANTSKKYSEVPMPGYTHMQPAMPTTVGTWLGSYADAYKDAIKLAEPLQGLLDQNPLGSASGFGIPNFSVKQSVTTKQLGFGKNQINPMYAGLSRGLFENAVLNSLSPLMVLASRFASDMLLFTTSEFGFFSLPPEFTTGSSIMPQKRNYDVFELMRGNSSIYLGYQSQLQTLVASLGSGYQRDLQLTKKPFMEGMELLEQTLKILELSVNKLLVHKNKLESAMSEDLFATGKVYELVKQGVAFREAYQQVKKSLD